MAIKDLFVVHATKIFPRDEILRAGLQNKPFSDPIAQQIYPDIRVTVHFTIGDLVRPTVIGTTLYSWEDCPYAIVAPIAAIAPQLINLNCYDCFTLGSVNIDRPCIKVIIPEEEASKLHAHKYEVWTYDPKVTRVRKVVEEVIRSNGGVVIELHGNCDEDILHPIYFEGKKIEQRVFFENVREHFPHSSICGLRWMPCAGSGYLFGELERATFPLVNSLLSGTFTPKQEVEHFTGEQLEKGVCKLKAALARVDSFVENTPYPCHAKEEFKFKRASLISWIHILECEIELNLCDHKTLYGSSPKIWERINSKRFNFNMLKLEIERLKRDLPDYLLLHASCCNDV